MATRRPRTAGRASTTHWRAHANRRGRSGRKGPPHGVPAGLGATGLEGRSQCAHRDALVQSNADETRKYAAELVALAPDVILAIGNVTLAPLIEVTRTVPIVFTAVLDQVGAGVVETLSRPGGNVTGFMMFEYSLSGKWLELLREIAPQVTRAGVLREPAFTAGIGQFAVIQAVAPSLGIEVS